MNIKRALIIFLISVALIFPPAVVFAATVVNTFQATSDGAQQKDAIIHGSLVAYTNFGGNQGIDVWGYDLESQNNFPLVERPGDQFLTGHFGKYLVYEDYDGVDYNIRLFNKNTGQDMLVAGGPGSQTSGVTNGKVVAYIDGGACGSLKVYDIHQETTQQIINSTCHPIRISGDTIVYPLADSAGTNIGGYNLGMDEAFDISMEANFQESPNIFGSNVVWHHYITGGYGDYEAIKLKNLKTGEIRTIYETNTDSLGGSAVSNRYVVWSQSPSQHVNKIMGADLKTGEVFEVQPAGPHQNSHTTPSIWKNTAAWMSFRTGNGDIYGSEFKFFKSAPPPSPSPLLLDNFGGPSLDSDIWDVFQNGGNISFSGGNVVLSAGSAMPFIRAKSNPFPLSGPFTLEFGIQYLTQAEGGDGVSISFAQQANVSDASTWPNNPLAFWQDSVGFRIVSHGANAFTISPSDFDYHVVKISYDGSKYLVKVDESPVYTSPDTARVGGLWFGHPNYCCTSGWTSFKLDYIKVTQP